MGELNVPLSPGNNKYLPGVFISRNNWYYNPTTYQPETQMKNINIVMLFLLALTMSACSTIESGSTPMGGYTRAKASNAHVDVFLTDSPSRSYEPAAQLEVEFDKKIFLHPTLHDAIPFFKQEARKAGADGIMDLKETSSVTGWTRIYRASATAIRYIDGKP